MRSDVIDLVRSRFTRSRRPNQLQLCFAPWRCGTTAGLAYFVYARPSSIGGETGANGVRNLYRALYAAMSMGSLTLIFSVPFDRRARLPDTHPMVHRPRRNQVGPMGCMVVLSVGCVNQDADQRLGMPRHGPPGHRSAPGRVSPLGFDRSERGGRTDGEPRGGLDPEPCGPASKITERIRRHSAPG